MKRVPLLTDDGVKQVVALLHPVEKRRIQKRADELVAERWPAIVAKLDAANAKRQRKMAKRIAHMEKNAVRVGSDWKRIG